MDHQEILGAAMGGAIGAAVGGPLGAVAGGALGGFLGDAYSKKPEAGDFATTVRNDLAPENVTLDAHQIYVRITTGPGSSSLVDAGNAAARLSELFATRAAQVAQVRVAAAAAWQGGAAAAATAATTPLADGFAVAQRQLAANAQALEAEAAAFDHIRSQVEFVPETPPQSSLGNDVNPFQTDTDAAISEYNAKAARNVQLYEAYVAETAAARNQVPRSYASPTPLSTTAAALALTAPPVGAASVPPPPNGATGPGRPASAGAAPGGNPSSSPSTGASGSTPEMTAGQGIAASDATARQTPPATTPSATVPSGVPVLPDARDTYPSGPLAGRPPRTRASDVRRGFAGAGPGIGGSGGVGVVGGGSGSGGGIGSRGGPAVTAGPLVPTALGQPGMGRGRVGGSAGLGGMPVGATGRGSGEEDREYRRKYRIVPDDEELFGLAEPYTPSVIGDDR